MQFVPRKTLLSTQFCVNSSFLKKFNRALNSLADINKKVDTNFNKNKNTFSYTVSSYTRNFPRHKIIANSKKWDYEEDNILLRRVIRYGWKHWGIISQGFPNRSSLNCYYRYRNNLKYLIDYSFICSINQSSIISLTSKEQQQFWKRLGEINDSKQIQLRTKSLSLLKQYYINMQKFSKEQQQVLPINYNLVLQTSKKIKENNNEESLFLRKNKPWTKDEIEKLKSSLSNYKQSYKGKNIYNWKLISSTYFPNRTLNDVKDKWHNIQLRFPWTKQDDQIIIDGVKQFGEKDHWNKIASTINSNVTNSTTSSPDSSSLLTSVIRSPSQCMVRWRDVLKPLQSKQKNFSEFEHLTLKKALEEVPLLSGNRINWKFIHQNYLQNRTPIQLYKHYYNVICRPAKWSLQEDEFLLKLVKHYQTSQETQGSYQGSFSISSDNSDLWKQIAWNIPGRTAIQCRDRYFNKLDPSLKKGRYTVEDQFQLLMSIKKNGHRWSLVAKELGRSKVSIAKIYSMWKYRDQFAYARKRKGGINSIYGKLLSNI